MNATATSFATYKDLLGYIKCLLSGGTETSCYAKGDNGIGCWGDVTATEKLAAVAVPKNEMKAKFGDWCKARKAPVRVTLKSGTTFDAIVLDCSPDGIVDLNPGALKAANLSVETELSTPATWNWL